MDREYKIRSYIRYCFSKIPLSNDDIDFYENKCTTIIRKSYYGDNLVDRDNCVLIDSYMTGTKIVFMSACICLTNGFMHVGEMLSDRVIFQGIPEGLMTFSEFEESFEKPVVPAGILKIPADFGVRYD